MQQTDVFLLIKEAHFLFFKFQKIVEKKNRSNKFMQCSWTLEKTKTGDDAALRWHHCEFLRKKRMILRMIELRSTRM